MKAILIPNVKHSQTESGRHLAVVEWIKPYKGAGLLSRFESDSKRKAIWKAEKEIRLRYEECLKAQLGKLTRIKKLHEANSQKRKAAV